MCLSSFCDNTAQHLILWQWLKTFNKVSINAVHISNENHWFIWLRARGRFKPVWHVNSITKGLWICPQMKLRSPPVIWPGGHTGIAQVSVHFVGTKAQLICEETPRHLQGCTCSTCTSFPVSLFPLTWDNEARQLHLPPELALHNHPGQEGTSKCCLCR